MSARRSVVLLLALALAGCERGHPAASAAPPEKTSATPAPAAIVVVRPEYRERTTTLETTGKAQFNEERLVRVHAPVTGRVLEVLARPGDAVEPGQRLLVIDSPDFGSAKADYAKATADAERAEQALSLTREMYEIKAAAQKDLREAQNDLRRAQAERDRAAARLRMLGVGADGLEAVASRADAGTRVDVTAPRSGIVVERNVTPGQIVAYGQSDTPLNMFVIADLSTMWVLADVYEPDVPRVQRGQRVTVTPPCCPNDRHEGSIDYISDSVDKDSRTVKVRVVVPNRGRALKSDMFVKVGIATGATRVLTLPTSAVHRDEGQTYVLVEQAREDYARRSVRLGAEFSGVVEIVQGVTPGDRVVASGSILLKKATK
jgi:membrane fusion protein, heavy metal efflux system